MGYMRSSGGGGGGPAEAVESAPLLATWAEWVGWGPVEGVRSLVHTYVSWTGLS